MNNQIRLGLIYVYQIFINHRLKTKREALYEGLSEIIKFEIQETPLHATAVTVED